MTMVARPEVQAHVNAIPVGATISVGALGWAANALVIPIV
jgi:hypothetical protein